MEDGVMSGRHGTIDIGGRRIGRTEPVLVVAEIGVNHDGSVERAIDLVRSAAAGGADAVKLQVFRAGALMHRSSQFASYQQHRVDDDDATSMLKRYELDDRALAMIVDETQRLNMLPIATPFSPDDVDRLPSLGITAVKIASPDLVNHVLLERAATTNLPLLVSTGAATFGEVRLATEWLNEWHSSFALLHCVSSYPTPADEANLGWIDELSRLHAPVGYSDHTTEPLAGALAVMGGACVIEKHLTYDRRANGPDHAASADAVEFAEYVRHVRFAEQMRGRQSKTVLPIEQDVRRVSRQSLVLRRDVDQGQRITAGDLTVQRPGTGIPAANITITVGRLAKQPLRAGTLLQWDMLCDAA
jgi:N,N'-diacetyllegionaminate synthase